MAAAPTSATATRAITGPARAKAVPKARGRARESCQHKSLVVCARPVITASVHIVDKHLRKLESGGVVRVGISHRVECPASEGNDGNWAEA